MIDHDETLIRIEAPHFVAGVVAKNGKIVDAANIVKYMKGWDGRRFADYCKSKKWAFERVKVIDRSKDVGRKYWCNVHERPALSSKRDGTPCCDPKLGGVMMPCIVNIVDITDLLEDYPERDV